MEQQTMIGETICEIFEGQQTSRIVEDSDVTKIFSLYKNWPKDFIHIVGACIINIFQNSKKMSKFQMTVYEKLIDKVFKKIITESFTDVDTYKAMKIEACNVKIEDNAGVKYEYFKFSWPHERSIIYFIKIFTSGLGCQISSIQMFCAKCLINILKNFDGQKDFLERLLTNHDSDEADDVSEDIDSNQPGLISRLIDGAVLMMQANRQNQTRMAGLKIGSYLQFQDRDQLLLKQLITVMCSDDNKEIRKSAAFNLQLNRNTIPYFVKRLRDKDDEVRKEVLLKIKKSKLDVFSYLNLAQKYNFIDDGIRFKDPKLKKSFMEYMFQVIWGSIDMNTIPASDLMLKLKAF